MTLQELAQLCRDVRYQGLSCASLNTSYNPRAVKPNATHPFDGGQLPEGYVYLSVWINAVDVDDDSRTQIEIGSLVAITEIERTTHDTQLTFIMDTILQLQHHEVRETFSYQGKRPFDPHFVPGLLVTKTKVEEAA